MAFLLASAKHALAASVSSPDMPRVLNRSKHGLESDAIYIGRPSKWGNPFLVDVDGTRKEVIQKYKDWILSKPDLVAAAKRELRGRDLLCHCSPKACHGDVLLEIANS